MKLFKWAVLCTLPAAMTLLIGCADSETGDSMVQHESGDVESADYAIDEVPGETVTTQKVPEDAGRAMEGAGELAQRSREEFTSTMNEQLAALDQKKEELDQRAANLSDEAKAEWQPIREELQQRRDQFGQQMERLQSAGAETWSGIRVGTASAWSELQQTFEKASQFVREKAAETDETTADQPDADAAEVPAAGTPAPQPIDESP
jgi:DNA repair exonuclease SbcCD ATPase subunit